MIVYCRQDMAYCDACGHSRRPVETKWGLLNIGGTPKPACRAVKELIASSGR